jgi:hypothetical protein
MAMRYGIATNFTPPPLSDESAATDSKNPPAAAQPHLFSANQEDLDPSPVCFGHRFVIDLYLQQRPNKWRKSVSVVAVLH